MPRYSYRCNSCDKHLDIFHLFDETVTDCTLCAAPESLVKVLTSFTTKRTTTAKHKIGDLTESHIKEAQEHLSQQKQQLEDDR